MGCHMSAAYKFNKKSHNQKERHPTGKPFLEYIFTSYQKNSHSNLLI